MFDSKINIDKSAIVSQLNLDIHKKLCSPDLCQLNDLRKTINSFYHKVKKNICIIL